jgi:hypothetical protein
MKESSFLASLSCRNGAAFSAELAVRRFDQASRQIGMKRGGPNRRRQRRQVGDFARHEAVGTIR